MELIEDLEGLEGLGELGQTIGQAIEEGIQMGANTAEELNFTYLDYAKGVNDVVRHMENIAQGIVMPQGYTFKNNPININPDDVRTLTLKMKRDRYFISDMINKWSTMIPRHYSPEYDNFTPVYQPRERYLNMEDIYHTGKENFWRPFVDFPATEAWDENNQEYNYDRIYNPTSELTWFKINFYKWIVRTEYMLGLRQLEDVREYIRNDTNYFFKPKRWKLQPDEFYKEIGHQPENSGWLLDPHYYLDWFNETWNKNITGGGRGTNIEEYQTQPKKWRALLEPYSLFPLVEDGNINWYESAPLEKQKELFDSNIPEEHKSEFLDFYNKFGLMMWDFLENPTDNYGILINNIQQLSMLNDKYELNLILTDPNLTEEEKIMDIDRDEKWDVLYNSFISINNTFTEIGHFFEDRNILTNQGDAYQYARETVTIKNRLDPAHPEELFPFTEAKYNTYVNYQTYYIGRLAELETAKTNVLDAEARQAEHRRAMEITDELIAREQEERETQEQEQDVEAEIQRQIEAFPFTDGQIIYANYYKSGMFLRGSIIRNGLNTGVLYDSGEIEERTNEEWAGDIRATAEDPEARLRKFEFQEKEYLYLLKLKLRV